MAHVELAWNPLNEFNSGPCIEVVVVNSRNVIDSGREVGLNYDAPVKVKALLDTGASVTVISRTLARSCKLFPTSVGSKIRTLGNTIDCGEHAGAISFPGTKLKSFDLIRIRSADFTRERNHACLIGTDIMRHWSITFDGPGKRVIIEG